MILQVSKLMERVEATFIKHFSNSNRSKGMNILRPTAKRERHRTTFSTGKILISTGLSPLNRLNIHTFKANFAGFFAGCTVALIIALILIIRTHDILSKEGQKQYMDNMFPLYR